MELKNVLHILIVWTASSIAEDDWTKECNKCACIWVSGRKTANCDGRNLNEIPKDLSSAIRDIDFSNNPLYDLGSLEFKKANLRDIHKMKFHNCSIELLSESAFNDLALMIELDLSSNKIGALGKEVFRDNIKLRILILSYNRISVLEESLFYNLTFLQRILLDHNQIETISPETFKNLPALNHINLGYNRIQRITFDLNKNSNLPKLNSLNVEGNPWICDCLLEGFRQSTLKSNLITTRTECESPPKLQGRFWQDSVIFACVPQILTPQSSDQIEARSYNVTLTCKVSGDPTPDVDWMNNGHIIERDPRKNKQKYITFKNRTGPYTWNNLTITGVTYKDKGDYKCIAKNPGGEDERNVTLLVPAGPLVGTGVGGGVGGSVLWIVAASAGVLFLIFVILLLVCFFSRRSSRHLAAKRADRSDSSEEYISMSGGGRPDIKKGLITDVNPVTKPPRATVPSSVVSGGTEVSDVKRNLLDNESVFDCDDESRSLDFDQPLLRKSHHPLLDSPYLPPSHYPPDLLPFPARHGAAPQVSPAASSASTVADTSRLPMPQQNSPLHSPIYDQLSLYRTLPYSRSQSPFVGSAARVPRQGYVTIPRRPRQQSWSSEPPNVSDLIPEPLYDNLGVRSTADGGASQLSLNKIGESAPATTPRSNRMFPLTPTTIAPIAETHEHPPSQPMHTQTLPRHLPSNAAHLTSPRSPWGPKANADAASLTPEKEKRNSTASLPSPDGKKPAKIPPRPPPKPKKRLSTGPLFEDEGEDGTEV